MTPAATLPDAAAPAPPHPADRRQRILGSLAMVAVGIIGACLVLQQRLADGQDDIAYLHTDGPFRTTIATDGTPQLGTAMIDFHRGDTFGWATTLCVPHGDGLLMQARLIDMADNHVALYRARELAADTHGCSSAVWSATVPPDAPPGHYVLQRLLLLTPQAGPPRTHALPPMSLKVLP